MKGLLELRPGTRLRGLHRSHRSKELPRDTSTFVTGERRGGVGSSTYLVWVGGYPYLAREEDVLRTQVLLDGVYRGKGRRKATNG